jgi:hypothetical protein
MSEVEDTGIEVETNDAEASTARRKRRGAYAAIESLLRAAHTIHGPVDLCIRWDNGLRLALVPVSSADDAMSSEDMSVVAELESGIESLAEGVSAKLEAARQRATLQYDVALNELRYVQRGKKGT